MRYEGEVKEGCFGKVRGVSFLCHHSALLFLGVLTQTISSYPGQKCLLVFACVRYPAAPLFDLCLYLSVLLCHFHCYYPHR